jgi:hypothetical protein
MQQVDKSNDSKLRETFLFGKLCFWVVHWVDTGKDSKLELRHPNEGISWLHWIDRCDVSNIGHGHIL